MNPRQHPKLGRDYRKRARRILTLKRAGKRNSEIGREIGITGQRVGQIVDACQGADLFGDKESVFAGLWTEHNLIEARRKARRAGFVAEPSTPPAP